MTYHQEKVVDLVCEEMSVDKALLFTKTRKRTVVLAKHICMYLFKNRFGMTYEEIGHAFARDGKWMDHTSVIHACNTIQNGVDVSEDIVVNSLNKIVPKLDAALSRKINKPNKLVISFNPDFEIIGVIKLLKRHYTALEYEIK